MIKTVLGHIDCPYCGTAKGMRITPDKNGEPFGYCEAECSGQLRVGGDKRRVAAFVARHPWAKAPAEPVTAPAPVAEAKQAPAKPAEPAKPVKKPSSNPFDFLLQQVAKA